MKKFILTWQQRGDRIQFMPKEFTFKEVKAALKVFKKAHPTYKWKPKQCK